MIYTVTFNPTLDYTVKVDNFALGKVNRTSTESYFSGGKGINVSVVLKNLEIENVALGFSAGFVGDEILKRTENLGIKTDFIKLEEGISRINLKLKSDVETEINAKGPDITKSDMEKLFNKIDNLKDGDYLVLAGSIPDSLEPNTYENIMKRLSDRKINIAVDATKDLLLNVMKYHPFVVKPNNHELGEMFNTEIKSEKEAFYYAKELQKMGGRNIIVSMASKGAVFVGENGNESKCPAIGGKAKNSVGAGDSMVAGFIAGYIKYNDFDKAFKLGVASGSATALSETLGTKEEIMNLYNSII